MSDMPVDIEAERAKRKAGRERTSKDNALNDAPSFVRLACEPPSHEMKKRTAEQRLR